MYEDDGAYVVVAAGSREGHICGQHPIYDAENGANEEGPFVIQHAETDEF